MSSSKTPTAPLVSDRQRRSSLWIFFFFMLLHQSDRYLIGPLTTPIMDAFQINEAQMGAVLTGAILVGAIFFPLWGYLYDRYARPKVLALASFLWGSTTWLAAIVPNYGSFVAARATTGIDDASYPGIYSMVSDLYSSEKRGRILATLQLSGPLGYIIATIMGLALSDSLGWRSVFYLTGGLGIVMAVIIWFRLKDVPRGISEPSISELAETGRYTFNWTTFKRLIRRRTVSLLFLQVLVHLFPIQALLLWSIRYFEVERGFSNNQIYGLSIGLVVVGMGGFLAAGWLGDQLFKRTPRGRLLVGAAGVGLAAISFALAFAIPSDNVAAFMLIWSFASFFYGFSQPTTTPALQDITEPEVRSTAHATLGIAEQSGSAIAPLVVGLIAASTSLGYGLLLATGIGFGLSSLLLFAASFTIKKDVADMQAAMEKRAQAGNQLD